MNVGQTKIAARMAECQPFVLQPKKVQNRRVEIMDVDTIAGDGNAVIIRRAVNDSALDPAAGHP